MSLLTGRRAKNAAALLAIPALLLAFTACAANPGADSGSGSGGGSSSGSNAHSGSGQSEREAWQLKFARCMRDNGVDMADPGSAGAPGLSVDASNQDAVMAASATCEKKVGTPPPFSPEEQKKMAADSQKMMLKIAKCYRDSGFDVPDPKPGDSVAVPSGAPDDIVQKCGGGLASTVPAQ
ncbi:hypothetical protein KNO15_18930 [Leifsonia shinshuensis]|uniref:hypothetical protein n=1 Tax=Leifsonia shinshuensis TaxID=150026 RepID=UPI001F510DCF|nr:hypothetical protein [Leifsonia shinshuensis]MCI0158779.1 hypothetical protein [Leifsonia shinshuensis]